MKARANVWDNIFEKYSNCNDTEEDGMDSDEFEEYMLKHEEKDAAEDQLNKEFEAEESDETDEDPTSDLQLLPVEERREKLTLSFSKEFIDNLEKVYKTRMEELGRMDLPFWTIQSERFVVKLNNVWLSSQSYSISLSEQTFITR